MTGAKVTCCAVASHVANCHESRGFALVIYVASWRVKIRAELASCMLLHNVVIVNVVSRCMWIGSLVGMSVLPKNRVSMNATAWGKDPNFMAAGGCDFPEDGLRQGWNESCCN